MPSPRKPDELCCILNKEGNCARCKKPSCSNHSFQCIECDTVCSSCGVEKKCENCTIPLCGKCVMVTRDARAVCPYCYEEHVRQYDLNYNEDEFDR